jgi:hypothetical protein
LGLVQVDNVKEHAWRSVKRRAHTHSRTNPNRIMNIRTRVFAGIFALLLALAPITVANAQSTMSEPVHEESVQPEWTEVFGEQVRVLLESGDMHRQENAMLLILRYEQQSELDIDFRPAVPALFEIYESDAQEGHRLLALSTLEAIGGEDTLQELAERVRERRIDSDRVRDHTLRVLTVHLNQHRVDR